MPERTKTAFSVTAQTRPCWVSAMDLTVEPVELEPHTCALVVAAGVDQDQAPLQVQWQPQWRQLRNSPEDSCPHPCHRECRGNWSPVYPSTVIAADAAKAVPQAHRKPRYQRVSIHSQTHTNTHPSWFILSWLTFACLHAGFANCLHVVECFPSATIVSVVWWYRNWIEIFLCTSRLS